MRFTTLLVAAGFAFFANAQTTTSSANAAQNSQQAAMIKCIEACPAGDVVCTSKCITVPSPNESQVCV